jgi:hypothetical protein
MIGGIVVVIVAQAAAAPLVARVISAVLDPRRSGEGEGRGVPRGGDFA